MNEKEILLEELVGSFNINECVRAVVDPLQKELESVVDPGSITKIMQDLSELFIEELPGALRVSYSDIFDEEEIKGLIKFFKTALGVKMSHNVGRIAQLSKDYLETVNIPEKVSAILEKHDTTSL